MNAKRKTRKHAESKSNLFDADALEELSRLFHETRQTLGPQQADADWMSDPLDEWRSIWTAGRRYWIVTLWLRSRSA